MTRKIYISLPISGRDIEQVKMKAEKESGYLRRLGYITTTPFDIVVEQDKPYGYYMGKDIQAIIDRSDEVYFCKGWWRSKGCRLEFAAALIYHKRIRFE